MTQTKCRHKKKNLQEEARSGGGICSFPSETEPIYTQQEDKQNTG